MSKKNKKISVVKMTGYEMTQMPKYNPFQTGHGVMKSAKYPGRSARKAETRRRIQEW